MEFRYALLRMLNDGELEKIYNHASFFEKRKVKHDIEMIKAYAHVEGTTFPLLHGLKSTIVLRDAICYMMGEQYV